MDLEQFFSKEGLYAVYVSTGDSARFAYQDFTSNFTFDAHCPECKKPTTYIREGRSGELIVQLSGVGVGKALAALEAFAATIHGTHGFMCSRNNRHQAVFVLKAEYLYIDGKPKLRNFISGVRVVKIGQYPSVADLQVDAARFGKIFDAADLADIKRAAYLRSHGIGAGSLVYLRRVIERIVLDSLRARFQGAELASVLRIPFSEKMEKVKTDLPGFLTENPHVYAILSAGVHEYSESECAAAYPVLWDAIEIILNQKIEAKERTRKEKDTRTNLNALNKAFDDTK